MGWRVVVLEQVTLCGASAMNGKTFLATTAATLLGLLVYGGESLATPVKTLSGNNSVVSFRGTVSSPTQMGAEYIIFYRDKNNQVHGLVYIQNSDNGACFQGSYESASNQIQNLTYAYPILGGDSGGWEMNVSTQSLNLEQYTESYEVNQVSQEAENWLSQCLNVFE